MANKHTPGPWILEIDTVFIGDKRKVQPVAYHMDSEGISNARLIAAAPDLLAALEVLITSYIDNTRDYQSLFNETRHTSINEWVGDPANDSEIRNAIAAIAKAKGE